MTQIVKNLPATWETWVQSLGWEDPLEKGMATHSNILAWRMPWTEEPGQLQSMGWRGRVKFQRLWTQEKSKSCKNKFSFIEVQPGEEILFSLNVRTLIRIPENS